MAYITKSLRKLIDDMDENFSIPEDWNEYLYEIEKNHNIIIKKKELYYCTNCQQTFHAKTKIKSICKCPYCKQKLMVRSDRLKWLEYKDNIMILDNCNGHLIVRLFEMKSTYKADRQEFEHSTVEYARKIVDYEYRELRNERISPGVTSFCVNHYRATNGECDIYFMRKANKPTESLVTVEVVKNKVVQKRIKHNEETTEKQNKFLKAWERKVLNKVVT